ncbi:hypothetical protein GGS26DRAFT_598979 [Hypomontagnella submonticulosa]|nr:hypothetical protein GGS26DRAFT_598979 [Hypomontagnella submonticulosa]
MELTQAQSPFFSRIPPEIRNQIYGLTRPSSGFLICVHTHELEHDATLSNSGAPNLFLTCKRAYKEAFPVLCGLVEVEAKGKAGELCKVGFVGGFWVDKIRRLSITYRGECRYNLLEEFGDYLHMLADQLVNITHLRIEVKGAKFQCACCIHQDLRTLRPAIRCLDKLQSVEISDSCGTKWLEIFQASFSKMLRPIHQWDPTLPIELLRIQDSPLLEDSSDGDNSDDGSSDDDNSDDSTPDNTSSDGSTDYSDDAEITSEEEVEED